MFTAEVKINLIVMIQSRRVKWSGNVVRMVHDKDQWRASVNAVMNFRMHKMLESSRAAAQLAASPEGLNSMEIIRS
jgi:hypothetical protein